jgi:hypothetical protein
LIPGIAAVAFTGIGCWSVLPPASAAAEAPDDQFSAEETFSTLMGNDVEARRTFIQQNARDVRFLDI